MDIWKPVMHHIDMVCRYDIDEIVAAGAPFTNMV